MDTRIDSSSHRYCARPWRQMTFLSDGTAVCACIDAGRTNPLGNIRTQTVEEIWNGAAYAALRGHIVRDIDEVPICRGCPNRIAEPPADPTTLTGLPLPRILYLESVAACNLHCPGCDRVAIEGSRDGRLVMEWDAFQRIIDGLSPGLRYFEYHLGGENFMHRDWPRMLSVVRERNPGVFMLTSTNGHFFRTAREQEVLVTSGIDCVIFSIDGARPASYARYRVGGSFERVMANLRGVVEARRRLGRDLPIIVWRYILFAWNDSDAEMDEARRLSREIGVDRLAWHLNVAEPGLSSPRYFIGSPGNAAIAHELWDTMQAEVPLDFGFDRYSER